MMSLKVESNTSAPLPLTTTPPSSTLDILTIEKRIDEALRLSCVWSKALKLDALSTELEEAGLLDRALEVVQMYPSEYEKDRLSKFRSISTAMAKAGQIGKAIETAKLSPYPRYSNLVLESISFKLAKKNRMDEALAVMQSISDEKMRAMNLYNRALSLQNKADYVRALEVAILVPEGVDDRIDKDRLIEGILFLLNTSEEIDKALLYIQLITNERLQEFGLVAILRLLIKKKNFAAATEVLKLIRDETIKQQTLEAINRGYQSRLSLPPEH